MNHSSNDAGVFKVNPDKTLTQLLGTSGSGYMSVDGVGTAAHFTQPAGMTVDGSSLYVVDVTGAIRRVDLSTLAVTTPIGIAQSNAVNGTGANASVYIPTALLVLDAGTLLVGDTMGAIDGVTLPSGQLTLSAGTVGYNDALDGVGPAAHVRPDGFATDASGAIYFNGHASVRRYDPATGKVDTLAGQDDASGSADGTGSAARFYSAAGIATDGNGNLYVSDTLNSTIRKVVIATGEVTTFAGAAQVPGGVDGIGDAARFNLPNGIVYDGKGSLYVADTDNGAIRRIEIATRGVTTYAGVLGQQGLQPGGLPARLNRPKGVAVLPNGDLAVTDEQAVVVVH